MANFTIGYDITGRKIIVNSEGKYVTHIPCDMSVEEILARLQNGERVKFDARNQGMQNIPAAQIDESTPVKVAPMERWPLFYAWDMNWLSNWDYHDTRTFEEFEQAYLSTGLTPEQEFKIIEKWKRYLRINPHSRITFEQFREEQILSVQSSLEQSQGSSVCR